ncbi:MAG: ABC transporter ATP-binding protein/permease [Firmicutes bacterium]|nr:ABC transporter ATP-binding protein/permease [Bacillota bacterium]
MKRLFVYLKPYLPMMSIGLVIKFLGTMMDLLIPWILAHIIDEVAPKGSISSVFMWGGAMIGCAALALFANIVANRMATRVAAETTRSIRHDLFSKMMVLSCGQIDHFTIPSLVSRLTSDSYHVHHMVGMMQRLGVRAPILLLGGIIVTLMLEPALAMVLILVQPLIFITVYVVSKKGIPLYNKLQQAVDQMVRSIRENITGIRIIKALSKTNYEKERFKTVSGEVVKREKRVGLTMSITNPMMNLFLNLGLSFVILVGAYRVNGGLTKPGVVIAFLTYFTVILNAMLSISRIFILASKGLASFNRIAEIIDTPEDLLIEDISPIETENHIVFDNVTFSYHKNQANLTKIDFAIKPGETLGIIGPTGSGKSSIIKLLLRFYDVDQGAVRINGRDVRSIPREELHKMFGIAFQNDILFADTIAENIDFGRGLPLEQIMFYSELAQACDFIDSLEEGWHHNLTIKGANLSGGQKQRVLISRALAAKPKILILDDSSSALDYRTDAKLRKSLHQHFDETTTIIIAQRISSIMHADHILVLEEGEIIGSGTHQELMKTCEAYIEISRSQLGGDSHE